MDKLKKTEMTITDPVHGSIPLIPLQKDLIRTVEVQRLNFIHQLGTAFHVYPAAHAMRFAHALGVSHLARRMGMELILDNERLSLSDLNREQIVLELAAAGMLHDICHTPWSHTLEPLFLELNKKTHMDLIMDILSGRWNMPIRGAGKIPEILRDYGIDPLRIARLVSKEYTGPKYVQQMIFGEVDADTLDYLKRDFHFTGASFGHIDIDRIIQTMVVYPDRMYFQSKGLQAVRDFLNARVEMYSAVYLHKKSRITDLMLLSAARKSIIEFGEFQDFWCLTDDELLSAMANSSKSEYVRDITWRIKYRQGLFKRIFDVKSGNVGPHLRKMLMNISRIADTPKQTAAALEQIISEEVGIPRGYVLVDIVYTVTDISEQRFKELDIVFRDKRSRILRLEQMDAYFADYIHHAQPSRSLLSIYVPEEYLHLRPAIEKRMEEFSR